MDRVQIGGGIALGRRAGRDGDQAEPGEEVQILFDAVFAQAEPPGNRGHAWPALLGGAVGIALQHGVDSDAKGADLGGVVINEAVDALGRLRL
jgi:hypothetical protein